MSWRTVVIHNTAKLDFQLNYLVVRSDMNTTKIHISEIHTLLVESTAVSLTVGLLAELVKRKVKVIFCDQKRNPSSELIGYYGAHDTSNKVRSQISWSSTSKAAVWTEIVREKIFQQQLFLQRCGKEEESALLSQYIRELKWCDETNREGHAAKVYFNALFGRDFSRNRDNTVNSALNYGYSILLSSFNREITANGYITQLGIFHENMFNPFNLSSDLMEPFRVLVDRQVVSMDLEVFEHKQKMQIVDLLNHVVTIDGKSNVVTNAIKIYTKSVLDALSQGDIAQLRFYSVHEL